MDSQNTIRKISESIQRISGKANKTPILFEAEVTAINGDTCTVMYGDLKLTGVKLTAIADGLTNKMILKPKVSSMVLIADLSGGGKRDLTVVAFNEIDSITINGGSLGGLTNTLELKTQLDKMTKRIDGIISALKTANLTALSPQGDSGSLITTALGLIVDKETFSNIEDTKIKH